MHVRKIYDELTQSQDEKLNAKASDKEKKIFAGAPIEIHRYENWKDINRLLAMAERFENVKADFFATEDYTGLPPAETENAVQRAGLEAMRGWDGELGIGFDASYDAIRQRILQLRRIRA